jgi:predicted TIM-barrel fold metal-dependent hydrolase
MWFDVVSAMRDVPNLWLETSVMLGEAVRAVVRAVGADRVLFGSGEPRNRYAAALRTLDRIGLSEPQRDPILRNNAQRLFRLP